MSFIELRRENLISLQFSKWHSLFGGLFVFLGVVSLGNPLRAEPPMGTVSPVDLLKALPSVPPEWIIKKSTGQIEFTVRKIPVTSAVRQYLVPPPAQTPPPALPPPPGTLKLVVADLGSMQNTAKTPPPPLQKSEESFSMSSLNGTLQNNPNNHFVFTGYIGNRILVRIMGQDFKPDDFKKALHTLDFAGLAMIEKQLPTDPIKAFKYNESIGKGSIGMETMVLENIYVDELNPKSSRSWQTTAATFAQ